MPVTESAVIAINYSDQVEVVVAPTGFANAVLAGILGAVDTPVADASGNLSL